MSDEEKIPYLKIDRGRYFYQRRVPKRLQAHLGVKRWQLPCGDVSYSKAVQLVVTWAEEHDALIAEMRDPDKLRTAGVAAAKATKLRNDEAYSELGLPKFYEMTTRLAGEKQFYPRETLPRPWQAAAKLLQEAEADFSGNISLDVVKRQIAIRLGDASNGERPKRALSLPGLPGLREYVNTLDLEAVESARIEIRRDALPMEPELYLERLVDAYALGFDPEIEAPSDPDDKDEFDFIKKKLERKISELSPDPNTITTVAERYYAFNSIRPATRSKYRREVARLISVTGDVPISHVSTAHLRTLRDQLIGQIKPASIQAVFTPIVGLFNHAFDEDLLDANPMAGVKLPRDKRPIEERKWKSFEPVEMIRILDAVDKVWGNPAKGLSDARRDAIRMVVRVLAYSGMRPVEVIRLKPEDVTDRFIRITGSKTESSTRIVPLHPEISNLPKWLSTGGLNTFQSIKSDQVGSVRHNFSRLLRKQMDEPILDPQKALYSLRSTFVNAMRRAGADIQVQRAILGHKEAGAIRHYDDGPEFEVKRKWVEATDPQR
ncbi:tyrosine-type recombinase/integrase [uncultured Tateyamaria sp.]|uniref:tyrosine-type recombinase/integrase n=1 Tax=uncultured Tateyamaria sp. TaxID=455651 RepID=UPI00261D6CE9|nr:tyrosine-type recombinase/integrase [uncultured Tateyamaria sp.]